MIPHRVDSLPFDGRVIRAGVLGSRGRGDPVPEALSRLEESPLDRRRRAGHDPGPCANDTCGEGQRINRIRYEGEGWGGGHHVSGVTGCETYRTSPQLAPAATQPTGCGGVRASWKRRRRPASV